MSEAVRVYLPKGHMLFNLLFLHGKKVLKQTFRHHLVQVEKTVHHYWSDACPVCVCLHGVRWAGLPHCLQPITNSGTHNFLSTPGWRSRIFFFFFVSPSLSEYTSVRIPYVRVRGEKERNTKTEVFNQSVQMFVYPWHFVFITEFLKKSHVKTLFFHCFFYFILLTNTKVYVTRHVTEGLLIQSQPKTTTDTADRKTPTVGFVAAFDQTINLTIKLLLMHRVSKIPADNVSCNKSGTSSDGADRWELKFMFSPPICSLPLSAHWCTDKMQRSGHSAVQIVQFFNAWL